MSHSQQRVSQDLNPGDSLNCHLRAHTKGPFFVRWAHFQGWGEKCFITKRNSRLQPPTGVGTRWPWASWVFLELTAECVACSVRQLEWERTWFKVLLPNPQGKIVQHTLAARLRRWLPPASQQVAVTGDALPHFCWTAPSLHEGMRQGSGASGSKPESSIYCHMISNKSLRLTALPLPSAV